MGGQWRLIVVMAMATALSGCGWGSSQGLDAQVAAEIRRQQRQTLGAAGNDPQVVPSYADDTRLSPQSKAAHPATINPPAEQLPVAAGAAEAAPEFSATQPATQSLEFDLPAVFSYAMAHAPDYRNRKEELFLAALSLLAEQHLWGPRFFDAITTTFSGAPEAGDHDQAASVVNDFRITQRLPYGGQIEISALVDYVNQLRSEFGDARQTQSTALSLAVTLPLLRGAGLTAQEPLIQAQRSLVYAVRDFEQFRRQFLVDVATAYFTLLQQRAEIDNAERQLENLQHLASRMEALALAGRQPYFEVQRAQQEVLFARNSLLNSQEAYASAVDGFKILVGIPTVVPVTVKPTELAVAPPALDVPAAIAAALAFRLDLQNAADQLDDARRQVAIAKNQLLPDLDLFGNVSASSDASRDFGVLDIDAGAGTYSAGLRLDVPLDRRQEQIGYRRSLIAFEQNRRDYGVQRERIVLEVRQAVRQIEQAQVTIDMQRRNVELAERRRLGVRLQERKLGPRDVIEAEQGLLDARNLLDAARRDLRVNVLGFLLATGQMRVSPSGQWTPPGQLIPQPDPPAADAALRASPATQESSGSADHALHS